MSMLDEWLLQHEGKTLEFKRDVSSPDSLVRTIVAFANGAGGTVVVGVEDRSRRVRGVADPAGVEERLANLISDRIEPRLVPELLVIPWRKTHAVVVRVFPSSTRPHYVKAEGPERGVYVRVGSTNRRADPVQVEEIKRFVRGGTFDEEPMPGMGAEAVDFPAAAECFAPVRKLQRSDLRTLQLTTVHQRREVPTVGGILLFGRNRQQVFPEAYLRAGCFAGADRSTILDTADIKVHLPLAVEEALHFIKRNIRRALTIQGARHAETWEYPLVALREAVINALVHADYAQRGSPLRLAIFSDRLEVDNPGGLPLGLTLEDIRRGISKLRNRVIGRVFHELGLIEQWGSGIQRMTRACREAGLPDPVFEEIGTGFRVSFWRQATTRQTADPVDQAILDFLGRRPGASTSQIAAHVRRTPRTTRDRLNRLVDLGLVAVIGSGPRDPRRRYFTMGTGDERSLTDDSQ
jgi:predicted HTH transcriptional regulator